MRVRLDLEHFEEFDVPFSDYWNDDDYEGMSKEEIEKHITKLWLETWEDWVVIDEPFDINLKIVLDDKEYEEFIGSNSEPDPFDTWAKAVRESRERRAANADQRE